MSKFTPGPWLTRNCGDKTIFVEDPSRVGGYSEISTAPYTELGIANAKLISASPDMLNLLLWIQGQLEAGNRESISLENLFGDRLKEVIAKAGGANE